MIRILIVEDEKPIAELIRMSLRKAGYTCTCAADGAAAADLLESNAYDLILLDVMLPEIDGFELMEYIRPTGTPRDFHHGEKRRQRPCQGSAHGRGRLYRQAV